ncbi:MAG: hypothetical protein ACE5HE_04740 [Phycisphaerae bacterium]
MGKRSRFIPLSGGDYFVLALDHLMRRVDLRGNFCRLVIQLDSTLDRTRFRSALARSELINLLCGLHPARRFPYITPKWFTKDEKARVVVTEHAVDASADPEEVLPASVPELTSTGARAPGLVFDLVEYSDGRTAIVMTWHHVLMDALGGELLVQHLNRDGDGYGPTDGASEIWRSNGSQSVIRSMLRYPRRLAATRRAVLFVAKTSRVPIASLTRSVAGGSGSCTRYHFISFDEGTTRLIDAHVDQMGARYHQGLFFLASTIQAFHGVLNRRGAGKGAYVVPVPLNLRKRGAMGPVCANPITFQFFRIDRGQIGSLSETYVALKEQMVNQLREGIPRCYVAMMEVFKNVPLGLYARLVRGPTRGQLSSFFYSYTGETCAGMDHFLGARVRAVRHMAPVAHPPGVAVVFSRQRSQLSATLSWVDGCFARTELGLFSDTLREQLVGGE